MLPHPLHPSHHLACVPPAAVAYSEENGEPFDPAMYGLVPELNEVLEEGLERLKSKPTWKVNPM